MQKIADNKAIINIGDIFFAKMSRIDAWSFTTDMLDYDNADIFGGIKGNDEKEGDPFLIAIKYLGNGIGEEMSTKEKLIIDYGNYVEFVGENNMNIDFEDYNYKEPTGFAGYNMVPVHYNDFLEEIGGNLNDYIQKINQYKKLSSEYPLVLSVSQGESCFFVTDETKKEYLKHTDKERSEVISKLKAEAMSSIKNIHEILDKECEKVLTITDEMLEQANLENKLYDFEKGRLK